MGGPGSGPRPRAGATHRTIHVEVPIELHKHLTKLAEEDDRTLAMYCRRALRDHVVGLDRDE